MNWRNLKGYLKVTRNQDLKRPEERGGEVRVVDLFLTNSTAGRC